MQELTKLFQSQPPTITERYFERALAIIDKLNNGSRFCQLGGKKLKACPELIRFKFGKKRLIVERINDHYTPISLIQRKNLVLFLKRRCS